MAGISAEGKLRDFLEREEGRRQQVGHTKPGQHSRPKTREHYATDLQHVRVSQIEAHSELKPIEEELTAKVQQLKGELSGLYAELGALKRQNASEHITKPYVAPAVSRSPLPAWLWSLVNVFMNGQPLPEPPGAKKGRGGRGGGDGTPAPSKRKRKEQGEPTSGAPTPTVEAVTKKAKAAAPETQHVPAPQVLTAPPPKTEESPPASEEIVEDESDMRHLEEDLEAEMEKEFEEEDQAPEEEQQGVPAPSGSEAPHEHGAAHEAKSPGSPVGDAENRQADVVSDSEGSELVMHNENSDNSDEE